MNVELRRYFLFFGILVLIDVIVEHSLNSLYEGFADLTLLFGFIPMSLNVIGVGWFIGLIFIFYLIFPFFCFLIENKRRAWISFVISLLYNYISSSYFGLGRVNILYSGCFFLAGGLIYLYKDELVKKYTYIYNFTYYNNSFVLSNQQCVFCFINFYFNAYYCNYIS